MSHLILIRLNSNGQKSGGHLEPTSAPELSELSICNDESKILGSISKIGLVQADLVYICSRACTKIYE